MRDPEDLLPLDPTGSFDQPSPPPDGEDGPSCALGRFVDFALYQPTAAAATTVVEVFQLELSGELVAADAVTCQVVLRATP